MFVSLVSIPQHPDYAALNRPYLEPTLVVEEVSEESLRFRFDVQNTGSVPAEQMSHAIDVEGQWKYIANSDDYASSLAPGATISLRDVLFGSKVRGRLLAVLRISFRAKLADRDHSFTSDYRFVLPPHMLREGQFPPNRIERTEGIVSNAEQIREMGFLDAIAADKEGSFSFRFHEEGGAVNLRAGNKAIAFDPHTRTISFSIATPDGNTRILTHTLEGTQTEHFLAITWSPDEGSLFVDGRSQRVSFY
jgi:hypothetical protein